MALPRAAGLPSELGPALFVSAVVGYAITFEGGEYSEPAVLFVLLGLVVALWRTVAVMARPAPMARRGGDSPTLGFVWIGLFFLLAWAWIDGNPVWYAAGRPWALGRKLEILEMLLLLTYVPAMAGKVEEPALIRHLRFAIFGAVLLLTAADTFRVSPAPGIDVWSLQTKAVKALLRGHNPYAVVRVADSMPGEGRPLVPFTYPPTQIYAALIGYGIGGDVRVTMAIAVLVAGIALRFIALRRPDGVPLPAFAEDAPALFVWCTPKLFFVLEQAWIDPVQLALVSLALAAHVAQRPMVTALLIGLALSSKQTMFWLLPLAIVVLRLRARQWLTACGVALATVLPFAIWNHRALVRSTVDYLLSLPARDDALTFTTFAARKFGVAFPGTRVAFLLSALVVAFVSWRARGPARFAWGLGCTYLVYFSFNKFAFANYYFLVAGLFALAGAASFHEPEKAALTPRPSAPGSP